MEEDFMNSPSKNSCAASELVVALLIETWLAYAPLSAYKLSANEESALWTISGLPDPNDGLERCWGYRVCLGRSYWDIQHGEPHLSFTSPNLTTYRVEFTATMLQQHNIFCPYVEWVTRTANTSEAVLRQALQLAVECGPALVAFAWLH